MYTKLQVCSKRPSKDGIAWRAEQKICMTVMLVMTVAVLRETFFFTTLTVSTNALVSLCDDTAEQRQLLSESKRYGKFIYRRFKNSRRRISVPFPGVSNLTRGSFPCDLLSTKSRQMSCRDVRKFSSQANSTTKIECQCDRDGRDFIIRPRVIFVKLRLFFRDNPDRD